MRRQDLLNMIDIGIIRHANNKFVTANWLAGEVNKPCFWRDASARSFPVQALWQKESLHE